MKATTKWSLLALPVVLLAQASCGSPAAMTCSPNTRQIGEDCTSECSCMEGLFCESGKCRIVCAKDSDCDKGQTCIDNRCVARIGGNGDNTDIIGPGDNTDIIGPGDNTDTPVCEGKDCIIPNEGKMPTGGVILPVSGVVAKDGYVVRVIGGVMDSTIEKDNTTVKVNVGAWKVPEGDSNEIR